MSVSDLAAADRPSLARVVATVGVDRREPCSPPTRGLDVQRHSPRGSRPASSFVLVLALPAVAAVSNPDSHTALAVEVVVVWHWLASTNDPTSPWVIPSRCALFVFHAVVALDGDDADHHHRRSIGPAAMGDGARDAQWSLSSPSGHRRRDALAPVRRDIARASDAVGVVTPARRQPARTDVDSEYHERTLGHEHGHAMDVIPPAGHRHWAYLGCLNDSVPPNRQVWTSTFLPPSLKCPSRRPPSPP